MVSIIVCSQELASSFFVTPSMRDRAARIYTSLSNAKDIHAPDLAGQQVDSDMLEFLNFEMERPADLVRESLSLTSSRKLLPLEVASTVKAELQTVASAPYKTTLSSFENLPALSLAGVDLFLNPFEVALATFNEPLLAVSMRIFKKLDLISSCGLNEEGLASYVAFIEEGCGPLFTA